MFNQFRRKDEAKDDGDDKVNREDLDTAETSGDKAATAISESDHANSQFSEEGEEELPEGDEEPSDEVEAEAKEAAGEGPDGEDQGADIAKDDGKEINTASFNELCVDATGAIAANDAWQLFINAAATREAAGEAIYSALFDSAPSLQSLFVTPRAVQAMRFMNGLSSFVQALDDPPKLKILVETLGFGHLHLDVTPPRVVIFRDAILDVFAVELAERFTSSARDTWTRLLNYVGGAIIYVKANYADRIATLSESWKIATDGKLTVMGQVVETEESDDDEATKEAAAKAKKARRRQGLKIFGTGSVDLEEAGSEAVKKKKGNSDSTNQVPTTYFDMFKFNSAVMGFGDNVWMDEVLDCFHNIVTNVSNSARLQEECDVLVLRIAKVTKRNVNFGEYKSCMLASLRSLLPKDWSTQHEVSWNWLWENVERIMLVNMGNPPKWEKSLGKLLGGLDENALFEIRKSIYNRFFALAPAGQDFFKQSNTYLHFIADRIIQMTLEIYKDPKKMVDDVSALGLRHVGYAIPTEFFNPFVSACVEIIGTITTDGVAIESFRWSLGLISKMLVRTINEGSTIVMKAINSNSTKMLRKAISCAPRGERSQWLLTVQVGTQRISPLYWSIESGALESAEAIIADLLVIRADRDKYYYGMDTLFSRHPEVIKTLCTDAPTLVPKLMDGLIWRSRTIENGLRRVNYYIKHLLIDADGNFSETMAWIAETKDPRLVCHPLIVLLSQITWSRVARQAFLWRKSWFLLTLIVFITAQSILKRMNKGDTGGQIERTFVFALRAFIYFFSMTQLIYTHFYKSITAYRQKDTIPLTDCIRIPRYLVNWQECAGMLLMIVLVSMLVLEPILWCMNDEDEDKIFYEHCADAKGVKFTYWLFSMVAMLLYYVLLLDLAVLSTKVSAYVLVCIRMVSEVGLFIFALFTILLAFSSSMSVVQHGQEDFMGLHKSMLTLLEMSMNMYDGKHYESYESDKVVLICTFLFLVGVTCFLINMLVAQLTCAYVAIYGDMVGYARLERIDITVTAMPNVTGRRWNNFLTNLKLGEKCEFNAGDVGVSGGIQVLEPQNLNPTTQDQIRRFGGSTSVELQWPVDEGQSNDESDRIERLELAIQKTLKRVSKGGDKRGSVGTGGNTGSGSASRSGDHAGGSKSSGSDSVDGAENDQGVAL